MVASASEWWHKFKASLMIDKRRRKRQIMAFSLRIVLQLAPKWPSKAISEVLRHMPKWCLERWEQMPKKLRILIKSEVNSYKTLTNCIRILGYKIKLSKATAVMTTDPSRKWDLRSRGEREDHHKFHSSLKSATFSKCKTLNRLKKWRKVSLGESLACSQRKRNQIRRSNHQL